MTDRESPMPAAARNRLSREKSPYLLQHAGNPVDWYPWGEEAFARAAREEKPVFLSIGYSTCHWCHVMEKESFEDREVADRLNRHFVSVKVDREERPDVDDTYMKACQMFTGSGGWPLTLVLTPRREPFFAATYLPKYGRGGMPGLMEILARIAELWSDQRSTLETASLRAVEALDRLDGPPEEKGSVDEKLLRQALGSYRTDFDAARAGFGAAPKFPAPHNLSLLLRIGLRFGDEDATAMALRTLEAIRSGGIYDQIGFGLHRYSVDAAWQVPHFEKMLYDQALIALAFLEGYQATGEGWCGAAAEETCRYVLRDLTHPEGGFFAGEDADSEGAEGTFYLWTPEEVKEVLGEELAALACRRFGILPGGNFEGRSIPRLAVDRGSLAGEFGLTPEEVDSSLALARDRLFAARRGRSRPHRDEKVLTAWNGLMIAALARTGAAVERADLLRGAERCAEFLLANLVTGAGRLLRRWCDGEAAVPGFLEDHAFLAFGLTELYQASWRPEHLEAALRWTERAEDLFADGQGGYHDTGEDAEKVLQRGRSWQDGALPSGASVLALNQLRLAALTGERELEERGRRTLENQLGFCQGHPRACSQLLQALDFALGPVSQVVLTAGEDGNLPSPLEKVLAKGFHPRTVRLAWRPGERRTGELSALVPETPARRGAALVCRGRTCHPPAGDPQELQELLRDG